MAHNLKSIVNVILFNSMFLKSVCVCIKQPQALNMFWYSPTSETNNSMELKHNNIFIWTDLALDHLIPNILLSKTAQCYYCFSKRFPN